MSGKRDGEYRNRAKRTSYNGTSFKSRLEATWAEWFEEQKIPWKYEPVKVQIDSFKFYTPDFLLGHVSPPVFVEVKPTWEMVTEDDRLMRLSSVVSNVCLGACGDPGPLGIEHRIYYLEDGEVCAVWGSRWRSSYSFSDWVQMLHRVRSEGM